MIDVPLAEEDMHLHHNEQNKYVLLRAMHLFQHTLITIILRMIMYSTTSDTQTRAENELMLQETDIMQQYSQNSHSTPCSDISEVASSHELETYFHEPALEDNEDLWDQMLYEGLEVYIIVITAFLHRFKLINYEGIQR